MNTRERLKLFLASINISEGAFEKATGLAKGFVSKVGDSIRTSSLEKIKSVYPSLNTSWLLTGVGEMLIKQEPFNTNFVTGENNNSVNNQGSFSAPVITNIGSNSSPCSEEMKELMKENERLKKEIEQLKNELLKEKTRLIELMFDKNK